MASSCPQADVGSGWELKSELVLAWPGQGSLVTMLAEAAFHFITILFYASVCSSVKWVSDTWLQHLSAPEFK